jgi:hypothetical protein
MFQERIKEFVIKHFNVRIDTSIAPKASQALFFITILNMDFSKSRLDSHKNLLTICLTSPTCTFFGEQSKDSTTSNDY